MELDTAIDTRKTYVPPPPEKNKPLNDTAPIKEQPQAKPGFNQQLAFSQPGTSNSIQTNNPNQAGYIDTKNLKYEGVVGTRNNQYAVLSDGSRIGISAESKDSKGNLGWTYKEGDKTTTKIQNPKDVYQYRDQRLIIINNKPATEKDLVISFNLKIPAKQIEHDKTMSEIKADPDQKMQDAMKAAKFNEAIPKALGMEESLTPDLKDPKVAKAELQNTLDLHASSPEAAIARALASKNPAARELGKFLYDSNKEKVEAKQQTAYLKQMESLAQKHPNNPQIQSAYKYHQELQESGRQMNKFDLDVYNLAFKQTMTKSDLRSFNKTYFFKR